MPPISSASTSGTPQIEDTPNNISLVFDDEDSVVVSAKANNNRASTTTTTTTSAPMEVQQVTPPSPEDPILEPETSLSQEQVREERKNSSGDDNNNINSSDAAVVGQCGSHDSIQEVSNNSETTTTEAVTFESPTMQSEDFVGHNPKPTSSFRTLHEQEKLVETMERQQPATRAVAAAAAAGQGAVASPAGQETSEDQTQQQPSSTTISATAAAATPTTETEVEKESGSDSIPAWLRKGNQNLPFSLTKAPSYRTSNNPSWLTSGNQKTSVSYSATSSPADNVKVGPDGMGSGSAPGPHADAAAAFQQHDPTSPSSSPSSSTASFFSSATANVPDSVRKAGVAVVGGAMVGVGLIMVPLPIPAGCVVAAGGMAVLGTEFPAAQKVLDDARDSLITVIEDNIAAEEEKERLEKGQERADDDDDDREQKDGQGASSSEPSGGGGGGEEEQQHEKEKENESTSLESSGDVGQTPSEENGETGAESKPASPTAMEDPSQPTQQPVSPAKQSRPVARAVNFPASLSYYRQPSYPQNQTQQQHSQSSKTNDDEHDLLSDFPPVLNLATNAVRKHAFQMGRRVLPILKALERNSDDSSAKSSDDNSLTSEDLSPKPSSAVRTSPTNDGEKSKLTETRSASPSTEDTEFPMDETMPELVSAEDGSSAGEER